jgi:signal transduction histidine kinase
MDSYPGPLGQVIANFISNALAHAFPAGRIGTMRLVAQLVQSGHVVLTFSDDGVGIDQENLQRIFDPFFTSSIDNNGLGLSISYNIVSSLLNGRIRVQSWPGQGSAFELDLPLTVAPVGTIDDAYQLHP